MYRLVIFLISLSCLIAIVGLTVAQAQNVTTSVQGVLRDPQGRSVDDGTYELLFKLYTQAAGGTALWQETQSNVSVSHGVFSVKLGAINPISNLSATQTYYLGVTAPGAGELLPRVELTKTFAANTAASVTGLTNVVPSDGNVGIGTLTPVSKLEVLGDVKISSGGKLYFPDNTFLASAQSGTAEQVTASGDANVIADNDNNGTGSIVMTTGTTERMRISNTGNVGIGTLSPAQRLEVSNGNLRINGDGNGASGITGTLQITSSNSNKPYMNITNAGNAALLLGADADAAIIGWDVNAQDLVFRSNVTWNAFPNTGNIAMTIKGSNGNVGIGTTTPGEKLEVAGSVKVHGTDFKLGTNDGRPIGNRPNQRALVHDTEDRLIINYGADFEGGTYIDGNVGIQTNSNEPLKVVNAWCDGWWWRDASDRILKNDIQDMSKYGLSTVMKMRPVSYTYKNDEKKEPQIGFIAQEMKEVVPEVVSGEEGSMGMSYGNLTAVLVNAIKEQQKQIEELKAEIQELKNK
ncbi:MAG: tail fiber domain-containing protein [Ignavibacteriae bacterium]|nr:tail fiber domain-containing protein [Ignavibacteriota bacterium]